MADYKNVNLDLSRLNAQIITANNKNIVEIENIINASSAAVARLTATIWTGESKDAFMERYVRHTINMKQMLDYINTFNQKLKTISDNGETLRNRRSRLVDNI